MLIKSECQPLDKTRHKPTWNLFEQREPCKMAREICNAACPLNSTHPPRYHRFPQHVRRDRQTCRRREREWVSEWVSERERDMEESTEANLFCSLSSWHQPSDTLGKQRGVWWHDRVPLHSHVPRCLHQNLAWQSQSWRQDIRTCWNNRPCNYGGTKALSADSLYERPSMGNQSKECLGLVQW